MAMVEQRNEQVAAFMADLALPVGREVRILEPGAGTAILTASVCERLVGRATTVHIDVYELHPRLASVCEQVLAGRIDTNTIEWLRELQRLTDMGAGQSADAISNSRMVHRRAPDCALGHFFLGKALIERSPDEARQSLERCVALAPDDTTMIDARGHLGLLLRNAGKVAEARDIWENIVRDYPDNPHITTVKMALGTD